MLPDFIPIDSGQNMDVYTAIFFCGVFFIGGIFIKHFNEKHMDTDGRLVKLEEIAHCSQTDIAVMKTDVKSIFSIVSDIRSDVSDITKINQQAIMKLLESK